MYKRYYIEVRDPSNKLKDFFLYDSVGEVRRALRSLNASRSLPEPGDTGPFQPMKGTFRIGYNLGTYELDSNDRYLADQLYSEHVPSLLVLSPAEIENRLGGRPLPIIEAARELEARRLSKGYLTGLIDTYWSRYRDLYLALLALIVTPMIGAFFMNCHFEPRDSVEALTTLIIGTTTIGLLVYRHFVEWAPVFWLSGLSFFLLSLAIVGGGNLYCGMIVGF